MADRKSFWAWCLESEEPSDYDPDTSTTTDNDLIKVSLVAGTWYRFVWDVACRHEGLLNIFDQTITEVAKTEISRHADGTCTDATIEYRPTSTGNHLERARVGGHWGFQRFRQSMSLAHDAVIGAQSLRYLSLCARWSGSV